MDSALPLSREPTREPGKIESLSTQDTPAQSTLRFDSHHTHHTGASIWRWLFNARQRNPNRLRLTPSAQDAGHGLGLHVLHTPAKVTTDIIFIHGVGGHSYRTWIANDDESTFWPARWLPSEADMETSRLFTFGYEAPWRSSTIARPSLSDLAWELLHKMKRAQYDLGLGDHPIVFVTHSMGGLVAEKACVLGLYNQAYSRIIKAVSAMIFLSTPHRGSDWTKKINRIVAVASKPRKTFLKDLEPGSTSIDDLKAQFSQFASGLILWSFYEVVPTKTRFGQVLVVPKDTGVLGYPNESNQGLRADHRSICKFPSREDVNYIAVRDAIRDAIIRSQIYINPTQRLHHLAEYALLEGDTTHRGSPGSRSNHPPQYEAGGI